MLYMVELTVRDVTASARWYAEALGFAVELIDAANGFVLLHHPGGGRLALKQGDAVASGVKLHLQVADLDAEVSRLAKLGIWFEGEVKASAEGYRRARCVAPGGVAVVLFEWCRPAGESGIVQF